MLCDSASAGVCIAKVLEKVSCPQNESRELIWVFNDVNPKQHQTYKWTPEKDKFAHCGPPVMQQSLE
jgi:hypothetical protein